MPTWLSRHPGAKVSGLLHPFFVAFREAVGESAKLHVLGHCFGGKYALRLAKSTKITSAMTMHPVRSPTLGLVTVVQQQSSS
jgi:dienelactone hydrolase